MTLDQVFGLLCKKEYLRSSSEGRTVAMSSVAAHVSKDGLATGRTPDGKVFKARVGGKSLAAILREQQGLDRPPKGTTQDDRRKLRDVIASKQAETVDGN